MTFESDRFALNLALGVFLRFAQAGKLDLLIQILIEAFKAKLSWDEAMKRADGRFYEEQAKRAVGKFREDNPELFETHIKVDGWDRWSKENKEK